MNQGISSRWPLVGREDEMATVLRALGGPAWIVTVHGEAGVGRSRLLAELAHRLGPDVGHVVHVTGSQILATVPLGALSAHLPAHALHDDRLADPGQLFAFAGAALGGEAKGRPTVVIADDVTLLDPTSQLLIAQLAAARRIKVLAAVRAGEPVPDAFVAAWNTACDVRVDLGPFTATMAQRLLETVLGGRVARRAVTTLHDASGGSPLYLRELTSAALAEGTLAERSGIWQLIGDPGTTPTLRDLVLARIDHLDPDGREIVERLAVCGPLRPMHLPGTEVRRHLRVLEDEGLISVSDDRVTLADPVVTSVVADTMARLRREDILTEQAALLAGESGGEPDLLQVTTWQLEAGVTPNLDALRSAARIAAAARDHLSVLRFTAAGLSGVPEDPELLLLRGAALLRTGRTEEAMLVLGRHPHGLEVTLPIAMVAVLTGRGPHAALELLEGVAATGPLAQAGVSLARAMALLPAGQAAAAEGAVAAAAELLGDSEPEQAVLAHAWALPLACRGQQSAAVAAAEQAMDFARDSTLQVPGLTVGETALTLATVQHLCADHARARATAVRALEEGFTSRDEIVVRCAEYLLGRIALEAGQLDAAQRWLDETVSSATAVGPPGLASLARLSLAAAHSLAGQVEQASAVLEAVAPGEVAGPLREISQAWLAVASDDIESAVAAVRSAAKEAHAAGHLQLAAHAWQLAVEADRAAEAVTPLREIAEEAGSPYLDRLARHAEASAAGDHEALIAVAGEWEEAGAFRLAAAAAATATRSLPRGRDMGPTRARAEELARRCPEVQVPALRVVDSADPLTPREREIARMAAAGATSKEIAGHLFLSSRTVDNHLQSVYAKLGISSRRELAQM
ncbi:LuxR family transcriptional regulator [Nocardioides limicola]|uniref:LuxR family transcriptional regulator n=1 Tax=Nocardioides limicola TaxID=2803368 RepID=UPI00193B3A46|nr:LuxR family transcriptional regulator [Nocardioides sp. DJM-14]